MSADSRDGLPHPMQPVGVDTHGITRFKQNAIVCFLLDSGRFDMNDLARMVFTDEDREQFAQLIGYSVSGFGDLSYASDAGRDRGREGAARFRRESSG